MNRHHPYGGGFDGPPNRRGGPGGGFGPGPDRSHRFSERGGPSRGRGGFRGGRGGGGGSYSAYESYDQGPPQGDLGGYNSFESGPPQDPYYGNGSFDAGMHGQFGQPPDSGEYDEGYGNFEDGFGPGPNFGGFGRQKRGGGPRRERDDKVHDSIIEERIQRERPCRTLFIRNIKYETNSEDVRRLFEEHGEIKTFFDLISNRGMVFVTYYDIRAAERARERLQGSEISGRPIDVHYSLPRDDHGSRGAEKDKNQQLQGTLLVTLRNSVSGQSLDDNEVRRKFQQFGDVREVRMVNERPDQRYVEFFDTRACEEAHDRLRHQGLQDGVMDIVFASDSENPRGQSPRRGSDRGNFDRGGREWDDFPQRGRRGGRGGRGRGRGGNWGGEDFDRRGDWGGRDRERGRPFEDEFGRIGRNGSWNDRFDNRGFGGPAPGPGGPPGPGMMPPPYGGPPPPPPNYGPPPPAAAPTTDERLEQAKKVQQLLAALKPTQNTAAPSTTQPAPSSQLPSIPPSQPPSSYYGAPPMPHYSGGPPAPAYPPPPTMPTSAPIVQPPAPGNTNGSSIATLPPNILALLQQTGQGHPQQPTLPPAMPQNAYSMPPPVQAPPPPVPGVSSMPPPPGQFQNLMSYLQQQKRP